MNIAIIPVSEESKKMVYKIYYADKKWQQTYNIKNPDIE